MKYDFNIMWENTPIGECNFILYSQGTHIAEGFFYHLSIDIGIFSYFIFHRHISDLRDNVEIFPALAQIPWPSIGRMQGIQTLLSLCCYGQSLTDKIWFNPKKEIILPFSEVSILGENSHLKDYILKPTTYEKISFRKHGFSKDVGDILEKNAINKYDYRNIDYNSPDLCTTGDKTKRWIDCTNNNYHDFWLMKYQMTPVEKFESMLKSFKEQKDIIVPQYKYEKFCCVTKIFSKCLVDENSFLLEPWQILAFNCNKSLYDGALAIGNILSKYGIKLTNKDAEYIANKQYNQNKGLLINCKTNDIKHVAWI